MLKDGYKYFGESSKLFKVEKTVKALRQEGNAARYVKYNDDLGYPYYEIYSKKRK